MGKERSPPLSSEMGAGCGFLQLWPCNFNLLILSPPHLLSFPVLQSWRVRHAHSAQSHSGPWEDAGSAWGPQSTVPPTLLTCASPLAGRQDFKPRTGCHTGTGYMSNYRPMVPYQTSQDASGSLAMGYGPCYILPTPCSLGTSALRDARFTQTKSRLLAQAPSLAWPRPGFLENSWLDAQLGTQRLVDAYSIVEGPKEVGSFRLTPSSPPAPSLPTTPPRSRADDPGGPSSSAALCPQGTSPRQFADNDWSELPAPGSP